MKTTLFFLATIFTTLLSAQTYIVNDTFETDVLGSLPAGWVIRYDGTGYADQKTADSPVKNGIHSLQISGSSWAGNLSKSVAGIPNEVTLEGWARAENVATGGRCGLAIGNPAAYTWGAFLARVEFYNGNIITYYHTGSFGTQYVLQTASSNTWYNFKIEANRSAGTYKVYINGIQASSNTTGITITEFPFPTTVLPTSIELYGNSMVYFDDVKLYETKELVAYYPFNGNANDESGNLNHGTVSGATLTTDRFGNANSAYTFDGNDIINIAHNTILNAENELSFSVWVKPTTLQNTMILGKSNYSTNTNYLLRTYSSGFIVFEYKDFTYSNSLPLIAGVWNHIAIVSDATNAKKVYVNNELASHTSSGGSPYGLVTNILTIGGASYNAEYFQGDIDDLRIYKSALSTTDISSLFNNNTLKVADEHLNSISHFYVSENTLYFKNTQVLTEIKTIELYNLLGLKRFETSKIENKISLKQIKQGVHILKIGNKNGNIQTLKILIQ